ncbi:hypothetical protein M422DRAFT_51424 [Sphaerobolus stellatus SS14]|uniref:Uncharacterized protein n=1 Tax=Sphaerobolus stellatus (strain SS14) TaxID=990650 RepID=A0A0C9ULB5_SPHS4|nr:hypothetical protein M422DRAFT_51424 [Sphaerobolus stellatus SS14]
MTTIFLCSICCKVYPTQKALNVHLSCNPRCEKAISEKVRRRRQSKQVRLDARAPQDNFDDDPLERWEQELDNAMQCELEAVAQEFYEETSHLSLAEGSTQSSSNKHVQIEEVPDEEDLFRKGFPGPAGLSYGKGETAFEALWRAQAEGRMGEMGPFED